MGACGFQCQWRHFGKRWKTKIAEPIAEVTRPALWSAHGLFLKFNNPGDCYRFRLSFTSNSRILHIPAPTASLVIEIQLTGIVWKLKIFHSVPFASNDSFLWASIGRHTHAIYIFDSHTTHNTQISNHHLLINNHHHHDNFSIWSSNDSVKGLIIFNIYHAYI